MLTLAAAGWRWCEPWRSASNGGVSCALGFFWSALALLALALSQPAAWTQAQSGGGYDLIWNTFDGGGVTFAAGGSYTLGGTAGQPDARSHMGGSYDLGGGFWHGGDWAFAFAPIVRKP